jgi:hypothetical protein
LAEVLDFVGFFKIGKIWGFCRVFEFKKIGESAKFRELQCTLQGEAKNFVKVNALIVAPRKNKESDTLHFRSMLRGNCTF